VIFRTDAKSDDKTELAVFVTVHVRQPDAAKADDVLCPTPGPALDKMKAPAAEKEITKATIDSSPIQDSPKPLTSFNASDLVPVKQESKQGAVNGGGV
jgi:hypothetical protein